MLTHRNLVANAMQTAAWFPQGTHGPEKVLGAIPMFHVYGLTAVMLFSIVTGNEVVLYPNPREIGAILKLIDQLEDGADLPRVRIEDHFVTRDDGEEHHGGEPVHVEHGDSPEHFLRAVSALGKPGGRLHGIRDEISVRKHGPL